MASTLGILRQALEGHFDSLQNMACPSWRSRIANVVPDVFQVAGSVFDDHRLFRDTSPVLEDGFCRLPPMKQRTPPSGWRWRRRSAVLVWCGTMPWPKARNPTSRGRSPIVNEPMKLCITQARQTPGRSWLAGPGNVVLQQSVRDLDQAFRLGKSEGENARDVRQTHPGSSDAMVASPSASPLTCSVPRSGRLCSAGSVPSRSSGAGLYLQSPAASPSSRMPVGVTSPLRQLRSCS